MNSDAPWPLYGPDEIAAVEAVLQSGKVNYWTGEEGRQFEREFAEYCGVRHAVALTNGSVALELALIALGIGEGADVVTTPRSFIASASSVVLRGARPIFADVDPNSQNITAETIERVLTPNTRAIIAVHHAGWPCEMNGIMELARSRNIKVIEDCAQAHGATYHGRPVGALGDVAAFSFCQDKIMTTGGEGGMLLTDDPEVWNRAWSYKDHGKSFDAVYNTEHPPGFCWLHESFGTNWRMLEVQAAIGRIQLRKLEKWVALRRRNSQILNACFAGIDCLRVPQVPDHIGHACYRDYVFLKPKRLAKGWSRQRIITEMSSHDIPCFSGSCSEIYLEKAFDESGLRPGEKLEMAIELGETSLAFLVHPTFSVETMQGFCAKIKDILSYAVRAD